MCALHLRSYNHLGPVEKVETTCKPGSKFNCVIYWQKARHFAKATHTTQMRSQTKRKGTVTCAHKNGTADRPKRYTVRYCKFHKSTQQVKQATLQNTNVLIIRV